jgi:metallophosphoesterase (TIGR00282 family)
MKVLFLGDIISRVGRRALAAGLGPLRERLDVDFCIGNVENAAGIFGITERVIAEISASGVDFLTSGNHVWDKREGIPLLESRADLVRPANYPPGVPGRGFAIAKARGVPVGVINLLGRVFMAPPVDCPFRAADAIIPVIARETAVILVDFHAEATSEKQAMGYYLDGRVSAVAGTHTHVQTADEQILSGGTGYITDIGMVGPTGSIIGVKREQVIDRFLHGIPVRFEVANEKPRIDAFLVDIDETTGRARSVMRIQQEVEVEKGDAHEF